MKCSRLNLQERPKSTLKSTKTSSCSEKPRRFCQQRMVNPDFDEDPRWNDVFKRFHCDNDAEEFQGELNRTEKEQDLYLTVQTLQFQGNTPTLKRPKSCFKYKTPSDRTKHRLFIKQTVDDFNKTEDDRTSALSSYYLNDYENYLQNTDKSRPQSGKSNILIQGLFKIKQNKSTQVDLKNVNRINKTQKKVEKNKRVKDVKSDKENKIDQIIDATTVSFQKSGKRKSLTISRTPSPETVQVIRVDLVCNRISNSSTMTDHDLELKTNIPDHKLSTSKIDNLLNQRKPNFYNKYILTNTIKHLDQNLTGSKVTLLCKTFRLSDRSKIPVNLPIIR